MMMFEVFHYVAIYNVFSMFGDVSMVLVCVVRRFSFVFFLKNYCYICFFPGFETCPELTDR